MSTMNLTAVTGRSTQEASLQSSWPVVFLYVKVLSDNDTQGQFQLKEDKYRGGLPQLNPGPDPLSAEGIVGILSSVRSADSMLESADLKFSILTCNSRL